MRNRPVAVMTLGLLLICGSAFASTVHNQVGKVRCLDCHVALPFPSVPLSFHTGIVNVCNRCHKEYHPAGGENPGHPVGVIPSMKIPSDMPLDGEGRMTCITCHSFHCCLEDSAGRRTLFLRREKGRPLCFTCHSKL